MKNANEEFSNLLKTIKTNYIHILKGKELTPDQVDLFKFIAKQYGFNDFSKAMMKHMNDPNDGMFFPTMAHISKHVNGTKIDNQSHIDSIAVMAFQHAVGGISKFGSYNAPNFRDKVTAKVISVMGGWKLFCHTEQKNMPFREKDFVRLYGDYHDKPLEALACTLKGIADKPETLEMNPVLKKLTNQQDKTI